MDFDYDVDIDDDYDIQYGRPVLTEWVSGIRKMDRTFLDNIPLVNKKSVHSDQGNYFYYGFGSTAYM